MPVGILPSTDGTVVVQQLLFAPPKAGAMIPQQTEALSGGAKIFGVLLPPETIVQHKRNL